MLRATCFDHDRIILSTGDDGPVVADQYRLAYTEPLDHGDPASAGCDLHAAGAGTGSWHGGDTTVLKAGRGDDLAAAHHDLRRGR
jgi:hypothetical protein